MFVAAVQDRRFAAKRQVSQSFPLPAPTGGINARDSITSMKPYDAISLENVFPEAGYMVARRGYEEWVTGLGPAAPVRTLMVWHGATDKLFGCASSSIYDANTAGATGAAVVTSLSTANMNWTNIRTSGGQYLIYVNGNNPMGAYDGTTWSVPVITGPSSNDFQNVCQFKERLWFSKTNSLDMYYLASQAIAGAATLFPLGSVFRRGGYVSNLGTFSRDAGEGPDDYFAIITNNGEIALYEGTDPSSANTWALAGVFDVGKPIGRRATVRIGGDLAILTQDGVVSMQALLQYGREQIQKATITGKIQTLFSQYAQTDVAANFGWQPIVFPEQRYLIVNIPNGADADQFQLVQNIITGSWTRFTGMEAGSWAVANNKLYFGGNAGIVYEANTGWLDDGERYSWNLQTSWQMVGKADNKHFKMIKPTTIEGGGAAFNITVDVDFNTTTLDVPDPSEGAGAIWPMTWPWVWVGETGVKDDGWRSVGSIGTWSSVNMTGLVNHGGGTQINAFEILAEGGGVL